MTSHFRLARQSAAGGEHDESSHHLGVQLPKPHCCPKESQASLGGVQAPKQPLGASESPPFPKDALPWGPSGPMAGRAGN